jgi:hypothetical protein
MLKQTQLISFILEAGAILALVFWDEINSFTIREIM